MKTTRLGYIIALLLLMGIYSCSEEDYSVDVLRQAQGEMDSDPAKALGLLTSIENPENMPQDEYMQYIVALVHCKYQAKQDINSDTLIWTAQRYYESKDNPKLASLANFYSGQIYFQDEEYGKAVTSFLRADKNALQNNHYLLAGRSLNNIGYIYWDQEVLDSAIIYLEKSHPLLEKGNAPDDLILRSLINLHNAYENSERYDEALKYTLEGLEHAKSINNEKYTAIFTHNAGVIYQNINEYDTAKKHFLESLPGLSSLDTYRAYLNLSRGYIATNRMDSAQYYRDMVIDLLSEIEDPHKLRRVYESFSSYYEHIGNAQKALEYRDMKDAMDLRIKNENKARKIQEAKTEYYLELKQQELDSANRHKWMIGIAALFTIVGLVILFYFALKILNRKHKEDIEWAYLNWYPIRQKLETGRAYYRQITVQLITERKEIYLQDRQELRLLGAGSSGDGQNIIDYLTEIENEVKEMSKKTGEELLKWAKNEVDSLPAADDIQENLVDHDILLFSLCSKYYTKEEIAIILNISLDEVNMCIEGLMAKMSEAGKFTHGQISSMLMTDNE
ncbi:MAG: tetratricopeptide repeat protein [Dysgonomonas sp.]|nr:tetratricopeptide repeat protein [Dysgonomonas sp.]